MSFINDIDEYLQDLQDYEDYLEDLIEEEDEEEDEEDELIELQNQADQEEFLNELLDEQELQDQLDELNEAYKEILEQMNLHYSPEDIPLYEMVDDEDFSFFDFVLPTIEEDLNDSDQLNFYMNPESRFKMD